MHGDACAPSTLLHNDGRGWQPCFFEAYGVEPDEDRIYWFRRLYRAES